MPEGIVTKSTGSWYEVLGSDGRVHEARIKGKLRLDQRKNTNPVAVGDKVDFEIDVEERSTAITKVLPRRNYIIRKPSNLSKQEHVIAANLDQVIILATLALPRTSQGFIDRVLVTAEAYEIPAVIVFNKIDLYDEELSGQSAAICEMYDKAGYQCLQASIKKEIHLDTIKNFLHHKTTLITGHSGVGKSSLLNKLKPELNLKTGEISGHSLKGKHTTTFAEMHLFGEETNIIDTPGIKDFGLIDMAREEVSHYFPEMRALLGQCKFSNCLHIDEPGCAVLKAVASGEIHPARYNSYLSIIAEEESHR
jgi:ribosome biogenesis GTPase / thiamine phosphate phosphatase